MRTNKEQFVDTVRRTLKGGVVNGEQFPKLVWRVHAFELGVIIYYVFVIDGDFLGGRVGGAKSDVVWVGMCFGAKFEYLNSRRSANFI